MQVEPLDDDEPTTADVDKKKKKRSRRDIQRQRRVVPAYLDSYYNGNDDADGAVEDQVAHIIVA